MTERVTLSQRLEMPSIMSPEKKLTAREHMHETSQVALFSRYLNSQEKLKKFQTL